MNKQVLMLAFGVSVGLTGCNNLLYSSALAPVYSLNKPIAPTAPALLNQTTTALEQPVAADSIVVEQAQSNPYGNLPTRPVRPDSMVNNPAQAQGQIAAPNQAGQINDPRIREGSEVLAEENAANGGVNNFRKVPVRPIQQMRPTATVNENVVTEAQTAVRQNGNVQAATQTVDTVKEQSQTAKTTIAATTANATETAASAKTAVRPEPTTTKSATRALLQEAKSAVSAGEYDKAASALERAHRIEPGNAKILYDIAQIRYAQGKYRQASSFASKAATYSNSPALSKKVWSLLSNARKKLGNNTGAAAAAQKAASFQ